MADKPEGVAAALVFKGMVSAQDSHDLAPGAAVVQVNVRSVRPGELTTRPGLREISFDSDG